MRVVVTGAFGFVGLNVARELADRGHDVVAVGRTPADAWVRRFLEDVVPRVSLRVADVARPGELERAVGDDPVDGLVHAAVITANTADVERDDGRAIVAVNVSGTVEALELARARRSRFVYVSTPAVMGSAGGDGLVDETVRPEPVTLYGITKLASERLTRRYAEVHALEAVSVRIAQPYGPGERATASRVRTSPIHEWLEAAYRGEQLVTGPCDTARDWTWVGETARGIVQLTTGARPRHDLYHLGAGTLFSVRQVVEALRREFPDLRVDDRAGGADINPNIATPSRRVLDATRFREEHGWAPGVGIDEGMRRYLDWRRSRAGG